MKNFSHPLCLASCNQTRRFFIPKNKTFKRDTKNQTKQPKTQTKNEQGPSTKKLRKKFNRNVQAGETGPPTKRNAQVFQQKRAPVRYLKNNYIFMYRNGSYQSSRALIDFFVGKKPNIIISKYKNHTSTSIRCVVLYMCR